MKAKDQLGLRAEQARPTERPRDPARALGPLTTPIGALLAALVSSYLAALALGAAIAAPDLAAPVGLAIAVVAAIATAFAARDASERQRRRAWAWVTAGIVSQVVGTSIELAHRIAGAELGYPSVADLFYLSFYPLLLLGILAFPTQGRDRTQKTLFALDCAIVALAGGAAFAFFAVGSDTFDGASTSEAAVAVAYPFGDMIVIAAAAAAAMSSPTPGLRASLTWIAVAVGFFVVGDFLWGSLVLDSEYRGSTALDTTYVLAFACFVAAATAGRAIDERSSAAPAQPAPAWWLPYAAIALAIAVLILDETNQIRFPTFAINTIAAAVLLMLVARQLISLGELNRNRDQLAQAQALAGLGSFAWDVRRDRIEFSEEGARLLGLDPSAQLNLAEVEAMMHPDDRPTHQRAIRRAMEDCRPFGVEARLRRGDGAYRLFQTRTQVDVEDGEVVRMHGTHLDITDQRRMESQLEYQANHDPLTGLLNRRRFGEELESTLRWAKRYRRRGAVLILGVDQFKSINDALGHAAGDATLKAVAATVAARARETDTVARLGGDEFALLLPAAGLDEGTLVAEEIRAAVAEAPNSPRLSVGVAALDPRLVAEEMMVAADLALHEAKRSGRDRVCVYRGQASGATGWAERIRTALKEERLVLYGQPMIDLATGEATNRELLIRMISEDGELIHPGEFLPTAERAGLVTAIDRWVTSEGLRLAREGERVSINLSAPTIGDAEILRLVHAALAEGALARDVTFEITETAAITHMKAARQFVWSLSELGCEVALDDFGTGFGSFTYLKHLPTTYLKIDREFVRDVADNPTDRAVVRSITEVAHSLGKQTVAEGVEDESTLQALRSFDVDWAQGYHLGPPARISPPTQRERDLGTTGETRQRRASSGLDLPRFGGHASAWHQAAFSS